MRRRFIEFLVLLSVAIGAGPVGAAIWQWSTTSDNNATADPSINWSEGMSPSSVNDSARAMMSVLAAWRNDISAVNTTAGSSTAYTLTTSEGLGTTPVGGQMITFIAHATNGISPTLTVDGGNTFPIWLNGSAVPSGTIIAGSPYRIAFNGGSSAWMLEAGYGNPYNVALGAFMVSTAPTAPNSSFIEPAGQCISTTTYAAYWVQQGSPASGGCPGGQFAVIDARGRVPVPLDTLNGNPAGRLTASSSGCGTAMTSVGAVCAQGTESRTLTLAQLPTGINVSGVNNINVVGPATGVLVGVGLSGSFVTINTAAGGTAATLSNLWSFSGSNTITGTSTNTSGNAVPAIPPMIGVKYYLRVL